MSAFFAFTHEDNAVLLTDGAWLAPDGRLVAVDKKVWALPNHAVAITGRGTDAVKVGEVIAHILEFSRTAGAKSTVDELLDGLRLLFDLLSDHGLQPMDFVVAAHSKAHGAVIFHVQCHDQDAQPFKLLPVPSGLQLSSPELKPGDVEGMAGITLTDIADKAAAAVGVMHLMRQKADCIPGGTVARHLVGGRVDRTVVSSEGITIRTVGTWPDEVGMAIDPARQEVCMH